MARKITATVETNDGAGPRDVTHCEACGRDVVIDVDGSPVACEIKRREKLRANILKSKDTPNAEILQAELDRLSARLPSKVKTCGFTHAL